MHSWLNKMSKTLFDRLVNVLSVVAGVLVAFLMIEVSIDVVLRYFFNRPISWTIEFTQYAMIFILYLLWQQSWLAQFSVSSNKY